MCKYSVRQERVKLPKCEIKEQLVLFHAEIGINYTNSSNCQLLQLMHKYGQM
jgi:hypothetical protein